MYFYQSFHHGGLGAVIFLAMLPTLAHSFSEDGVVTPINPFFFVGQRLDVYCNITNPDVRENSSRLFFEKNGVPVASEIINTRVIRLTKRDVQLRDDGEYVCRLRTYKDEDKYMGHQMVKVDVRPRRVQNQSCRVYNWETMTCTWDLGAVYKHAEHVNVSLYWVTSEQQLDCPNLTMTSCYWDKNNYKHGDNFYIRIVVYYRVRGKVLDSAHKQFNVKTMYVVEPAPVVDLQATSKSSGCVVLTWQVPRVASKPKRLLQQVKPSGQQNQWRNVSASPGNHVEMNNAFYESPVCGLDPHTMYDFRVAVVPVALPGESGGFVSRWQEQQAWTEEDVPSAAPRICPGCYFDLTNQRSVSRRVRIVWKGILDSDVHGTLTHYRIRYWSLKSHKKYSVISNVIEEGESHVTSADLDLPSKRQDYKISIAAATAKGESQKAAVIFIPALNKRPEPPQHFLVKRNKEDLGASRFFLSWAASARMAASDIYIVWCPGSRQSWQCQGELEWKRLLPGKVTFELVTNFTKLNPDDLLIGITSQAGGDFGSGIHWSRCVYIRHQNPQRAPLNVHFTTPLKDDEDSRVLVWDRHGCHQETSYVIEYLVRYCATFNGNSCVGKWHTMNVSSEVTNATLSHLVRGSMYLVHVVAVSSAGLGPESKTVSIKMPERQKSEDISGLFIILVGILSAVVFLAACCCIIRGCYRRKQKMPTTRSKCILEIEPTQKCPPSHHHRGRPLPEPPVDACVSRHIYGTSSHRSCMSNLGSDKVTLQQDYATNSEQGGAQANIPLLHGHSSRQHQGTAQQQVRGRVGQQAGGTAIASDMEERVIGNWTSLLERDKNADHESRTADINYAPNQSSSGRGSPQSLCSSARTYQRVDEPGIYNTPIIVEPFCLQELKASADGMAPEFTTNSTLPVRGQWPVHRAEAFEFQPIQGEIPMPIADVPAVKHHSKYAPTSSLEHAAVEHVLVPYIHNSTIPPNAMGIKGYHPPGAVLCHPTSPPYGCELNAEAAIHHAFCTCDNSSDDAHSFDLNENVLEHSTAAHTPHQAQMAHTASSFDKGRQHDPGETLRAFPPPGHPSSIYTDGNTVSPATDRPHHSFINQRKDQIPKYFSSDEYLTPQVPSS